MLMCRSAQSQPAWVHLAPQLGPLLAALTLPEGSPIQGCKARISPSSLETLSVSFSCAAAVCRRGLLCAGLGTEPQCGHREPGGE